MGLEGNFKWMITYNALKKYIQAHMEVWEFTYEFKFSHLLTPAVPFI